MMTIGKAHLTKGYARYRVRNPHAFQEGSLRTIDPGRPGHTKLVVGRLRGRRTTSTQAVLVDRRDYERGYRPSPGQLRRVKSM